MKFNFCPTCGEYLNLSYESDETNRRCPLGHSLQLPRTIISAAAILTSQTRVLMERKVLFNREFWALPHIEVSPNEQPESTLSKALQTVIGHNMSVESLVFAHGDEQMFHLFYELKLLNQKHDVDANLPNSHAWFSWKDMPWNQIAYHHHHDMLLHWLSLSKDGVNNKPSLGIISQFRGIKIL